MKDAKKLHYGKCSILGCSIFFYYDWNAQLFVFELLVRQFKDLTCALLTYSMMALSPQCSLVLKTFEDIADFHDFEPIKDFWLRLID